MQGNPREAPWWVIPLLLAEKWGRPPWEIAEARGSLIWAARQNELDLARSWKADLENRKRKR